MRTTSLLVLLGSVTAIAVGCGDSTPPPGPSTFLQRLSIEGPSTIAPGATAAFVASGHMSDGSTQDYSSKVTGARRIKTVLSISSTGQATGRAGGETLVTASSSQISARANVIVIAPGTFRLTGRVVEFGAAVKDATVAVTSGIGTGLSTQTTLNGDYRLYGVAGEIQVTVTKDGYTPLVQTLMVAQETLADFEIAQTTSLNLAGTYSMTIDASAGCQYGAGLPDDLKKRTYAATITQTGPLFRVELSGANFIDNNGLGHGFSGRAQAGLISFDIGDGYYTPYPDIIESLGGNQAFVITGSGTMSQSGTDWAGLLSGELAMGTLPVWSNSSWSKAWCSSSEIRVALTRQAASASRIRR